MPPPSERARRLVIDSRAVRILGVVFVSAWCVIACGSSKHPASIGASGAGGTGGVTGADAAAGGLLDASAGGSRSSLDASVDSGSPMEAGSGGLYRGFAGTGGAGGDAPAHFDAGGSSAPIDAGPIVLDAGPVTAMDCSPVGNLTVPSDPCQAVAEEQCTRLELCHPADLVLFGGHDACVATYLVQCQSTVGLPGQPATSLSDAHDCAAALINAPCGCVADEVCPATRPAPGTLSDGAVCQTDDQCAGGACSVLPFESCGHCVEAPGLKEPCGSVGSGCAMGLVCGFQNVCVRASERGQSCRSSTDCVAGLVCRSGQCGSPAEEGGDCSVDADACDLAGMLICAQGVCQAIPVARAMDGGGEACGVGVGPTGYTACDGDSYCKGGVCLPRIAQGAPCDPVDSFSVQTCALSLVCDSQSKECVPATPTVCASN